MLGRALQAKVLDGCDSRRAMDERHVSAKGSVGVLGAGQINGSEGATRHLGVVSNWRAKMALTARHFVAKGGPTERAFLYRGGGRTGLEDGRRIKPIGVMDGRVEQVLVT